MFLNMAVGKCNSWLTAGGEDLWPVEMCWDSARKSNQGGCCHHLGSLNTFWTCFVCQLSCTPQYLAVNHLCINQALVIDWPIGLSTISPIQVPVLPPAGNLAELKRSQWSPGSFWKPRCTRLSLADTTLSTLAKSEINLSGKFSAYFTWSLLTFWVFFMWSMCDCLLPVFSWTNIRVSMLPPCDPQMGIT